MSQTQRSSTNPHETALPHQSYKSTIVNFTVDLQNTDWNFEEGEEKQGHDAW